LYGPNNQIAHGARGMKRKLHRHVMETHRR
jgi:hypothetical protein